ncbi:hypothetical protein I4U23_012043 [Adineta vaga]|nr:hypothetical protein I4U23_012043 [Adineta vaga]
MNHPLNIRKLPSPSSPKTTNCSFHGRKLDNQDQVPEHSTLSSSPANPSTYLAANSVWNNMATIDSLKLDDERKKQTMEMKTVGKMGMVRRKQFLQKRDFSRSHELMAIM